MGFIKDAKVDTISTHAKRAAADGHTVFTPMLNTPWSGSTASGPVSGWAEQIEAVEAEGWTLAHWTIGQDAKGRPQAYPLFRR